MGHLIDLAKGNYFYLLYPSLYTRKKFSTGKPEYIYSSIEIELIADMIEAVKEDVFRHCDRVQGKLKP